jgi:hypothetical protein
MLSERLKDAVQSCFILIYEFGQHRNDTIDNMHQDIFHLLNEDNFLEFEGYCMQVESTYKPEPKEPEKCSLSAKR